MKPFKTLIVGGFLLSSTSGALNAATVSMQIVVDNDYAIFVGTTTNITRLVHQNNVSWHIQLGNLPPDFGLLPGEDTLYILAMGGGGYEEIGAIVNGINITNIPSIERSSTLLPLANYTSGAVAAGTYNANLLEIQNAFPSLTWHAPGPVTSAGVALTQTFEAGFEAFSFGSHDAILFRFDAIDVGVTGTSVIPEPSNVLALALLLTSGVMFRNRRRKG